MDRSLEGNSRHCPTRYKIVALAAAAVFICYMDRVIISIAIIPHVFRLRMDPRRAGARALGLLNG